MGKSPIYAGSVRLIRNLQSGYIFPQFHAVYDNSVNTIMGGYGENKAVANHIWDNLLGTIDEDTLEQAHNEHHMIPSVHED